jgi:hypothetical protein
MTLCYIIDTNFKYKLKAISLAPKRLLQSES